MPLHMDHVVIGAASEERARSGLATAGLSPAAGGPLDVAGLANLVAPVGDYYLEVIYPTDPLTLSRTDGNPMLDRLRSALDRAAGADLAPLTWLVRVDDPDEFDALAASTGMPALPGPGSRDDDGYLLVGFGPNLSQPWLPVFIRYSSPPEEHPSRWPVEHEAGDVALVGVDVEGPEEDVRRWCGGTLPARVTIEPGTAGPLRIRLAASDGEITIGLP